jgi:hypothetical protein
MTQVEIDKDWGGSVANLVIDALVAVKTSEAPLGA